MPELPVSEEQRRRLDDVRADLEAAYVGEYGSVTPADALEYLLDTYTPPTAQGGGKAPGTTDPAGDAGGDDAASSTGGTPGELPVGNDDLTNVSGVGEVTAEALAEAGYETIVDLRSSNPAALTEVDGIGSSQAVDVLAAAMEVPTEAVDGSDGEDGDGERGGPDGDDGDGEDGEDGGNQEPGGPPADRADASPSDTLQQAMSLLEAHDERWRESSDDEPYEVDLPGGSTEAVRTKDDVRRLLFKHWK